MIEFKGTSEREWLSMPGHRIKDNIKRLKEYKKNNQGFQCPFVRGRK